MRFSILFLPAIAFLAIIAAPAAAQHRNANEPKKADCPAALPASTECFSGWDMRGAYYWIAKPKNWNGTLVVHAHGGPRTAKPQANDPVEDLVRFAVTVQEGYAWAGSNYRREGYGVRMAAADTDNVRRIAIRQLGKPKHVLLHGQSWGGNVAAKTAELYALDWQGRKNYDGVVLTSGLLAGGSRGYDFRADLRAVYQYYCKNHPRADEVQYPVWQGLPKGVTMKRDELEKRVNECTGLALAPNERTAEQARNLKNILAVTKVPEKTLVAHLSWATGLFSDIVWRRMDGKNPFDNSKVTYTGSDDDTALNKGVERFEADPEARRAMAYDADLTGQIVLPTITLHAVNDPTVFVDHEAIYRQTVEKAGNSDLLVQNFSDEAEHSKLSTPQYAALFTAMLTWIEEGEKPTKQSVAALCEEKRKTYDEICRLLPNYEPKLPID